MPLDAVISDDELYARSVATLLACWEQNARGARRAQVLRLPSVAVGVFPSGPERLLFNNAVFDRGLTDDQRSGAVAEMEEAYATARVDAFAAWVHERDAAMQTELTARGYTLNETTRAMGMSLDDLPPARPVVELAPVDWSEYLRLLEVPAGLLAHADPQAFHVLIARLEDRNVATAMAFDHDGDCGIFNVSTHESARNRGLATALTTIHLLDAVGRGCRTASLQSTEMAEGVYRGVGFRDLGRFLEYVP